MPIYEYFCDKCQCQFELLVLSTNDTMPECPTCCGHKVKKLMSAGSFRPHGTPTGSGGFKPPKCRPSGG